MRMDKRLIYCAGKTKAARYAYTYLKDHELPVTLNPQESVTHLLLDVPSFESSGTLRMGGNLQNLLKELPGSITICGGNLGNQIPDGYNKMDLLQNPYYLAQNAWLTAESALDVALPYLPVTLRNLPVLILGWGRIGKCLAQLLKQVGADVTVAVRNPADLGMLSGLGYHAISLSGIPQALHRFRLLFNTVPAPILSQTDMRECRPDCVRIELASVNGLDDPDAVIARGLPGIHLPESSGYLIAETFMRYYQEEQL